MSELINHRKDRLENLYDFASRLINGENGKELLSTYKQYSDTVTPEETMGVLDRLILGGYGITKVKADTGRIIS